MIKKKCIHWLQSSPFSFCHVTTSLFSSHGKRMAEGVNCSWPCLKHLCALSIVCDSRSSLPRKWTASLALQVRAISILGSVVWPTWKWSCGEGKGLLGNQLPWVETRHRIPVAVGSGFPWEWEYNDCKSLRCLTPEACPKLLSGLEGKGMTHGLGPWCIFHITKPVQSVHVPVFELLSLRP